MVQSAGLAGEAAFEQLDQLPDPSGRSLKAVEGSGYHTVTKCKGGVALLNFTGHLGFKSHRLN